MGASGASGSFSICFWFWLYIYFFEIESVYDVYYLCSVFFVPHTLNIEFETFFEESLKEKVDEGLTRTVSEAYNMLEKVIVDEAVEVALDTLDFDGVLVNVMGYGV